MSLLDVLALQQGNKCFLCGNKVSKTKQSVEHLVSRSRGGKSDRNNCVMVCKKVNSMLGDISIAEKMRLVIENNGKVQCPDKK